MSAEVTHFDLDTANAIEEHKSKAHFAQTNFMTKLSEKVIEDGGYCDDKTFSAAFFGGIDPEMNWGDTYTNENLAAEKLPQAFKVGLRIAELIRYSEFEPFVAIRGFSFNDIRGIGIVMPGTEPFEEAVSVGFRIYRPEGSRGNSDFSGSIVFNGLSKVRSYRPYDQHTIFSVSRSAEGIDTETRVEDPAVFGIAAARKHILGDSYFDRKELDSVDLAIQTLQEEARQHHKTLSPVSV